MRNWTFGRKIGMGFAIAIIALIVVGIVAILLYVPAMRLAFSKKNGRELLPMLQYSARAQLQLGALLAVVLVFRVGV